MKDTIFSIIARETGEHVTDETLISDIGIDSLEFLDLILAIENGIGKRIDVNDLPVNVKAGDIVAAVLE